MTITESPSIEELRLLLVVAETGSMTETAGKYGVAQSTISKRLKCFRDKLLRNAGTRMELTPRGEAVLPAVRELLRQYDQLKACLAGRLAAPASFCVAAGASSAQHFLPAAIAAMNRQFPDLEVQARSVRGGERLAGLRRGDFDLAIVSHNAHQIALSQGPGRGVRIPLAVEELALQPLCLICRKSTDAAADFARVSPHQEVPWEQLSNWPLVGLDRSSGVRRQLEQLFAIRRQPITFRAEAAGWLAVREYARVGLGVGVLPIAVLSAEDPAEFVIRRLPAELAVGHYLVHREDAANPHLESMKHALLDAARAHAQLVEQRWRGFHQ